MKKASKKSGLIEIAAAVAVAKKTSVSPKHVSLKKKQPGGVKV